MAGVCPPYCTEVGAEAARHRILQCLDYSLCRIHPIAYLLRYFQCLQTTKHTVMYPIGLRNLDFTAGAWSRSRASYDMARRTGIDVFQYLDYRAFLRDFYAHQKGRGRGFSHRSFSKAAGLGSPNHLKRVMDGERNLSPEMATRFASACGLETDAARFFCELVTFNQATTVEERQVRYAALRSHAGFRRAQKLDTAHAAYHSEWYIPAIRELVASRGFREDAEWIGQRLVPAVSKDEVQKAFALLLDLGLLGRDADGRLVQTEAVVSTGVETRGVHIVNYHRTMMDCAIRSVDLVPREHRDISALTLCISRSGLEHLKSRVQAFRKELVGLEAADGRRDVVVQVNLQVFPLTVVSEEASECDI